MRTLVWYAAAAVGEIAGCYSFWAWVRLRQSVLWTVPGTAALALFALALTRIPAANAGRAYAAYGGVYIVSSLLWMWAVEHAPPDRWDAIGAAVCLAGAGLILLGPR